jgi:hypothetical protein
MDKTSIRYLALVLGPLMAMACGGSSSGSPCTAGTSGAGTSGAGTTGAAGASAGTAGDNGGAGTGTAGDTGACAMPTATDPLISDFSQTTTSGDGGTTAPVSKQANGGTDVWTVSPAGMGSATVMTAGEMHAATTGGNWGSMSTLISGAVPCLNMSKYTGVKFSIKSATNTMLIFEVATPVEINDYSYFRKVIPVTAAYTDVMVAFSDLMAPTFGVGMTLPATYKPAEHMNGIAFGVGTMTELLDVYLKNVSFY